MPIPLISDLRRQRRELKAFLYRAALFAILLATADRLIGAFLRRGLDIYYGFDRPCEVLCVGHSQTVLGIDRDVLERELGRPVAKYAVQGANAADRLIMIRHALRRHGRSIDTIVYGVNAHLFSDRGLSSNSYRLFFPYLDDPVVRRYVRRQCASPTDYALRLLIHSCRFNEVTLSFAWRGYLRNWSNLKRGTVEAESLKRKFAATRQRPIRFNEETIGLFEQTIELAGAQDCALALVYIPTLDLLNELDPEGQARAVKMLADTAKAHPRVWFIDYNRRYEHDHSMFYDARHLNPHGQTVITRLLAADLKRLNPSSSASTEALP